MISIFRDPQLANEFEENGYVVLPFLDSEAVSELKGIYAELPPIEGDTFFSSSFIRDLEFKKAISARIEAIFRPKVDEYFQQYKKLGAGFLVKPPSASSIMPIHQDWTIVDESQYASITIWLPLQDVDSHNGAIKVLPKSHRLSNALRSPTIDDPIADIKPLIEEDLITLPMKAGEAFIFTHAVAHASNPNLSDAPRVAIAFGMIHEDARMYYYFRPQGTDQVEKLSIRDDFFLNYPDVGQRPPDAQVMETLLYEQNRVTAQQYRSFYGKPEPQKVPDAPTEKPGLLSRLKRMFA
jgi:hypothetical protein